MEEASSSAAEQKQEAVIFGWTGGSVKQIRASGSLKLFKTEEEEAVCAASPQASSEVAVSGRLLLQAEPLGVGMGRVQEVLLVLQRRRPLGAAAPLPDGPDRNRLRVQARRLLPQPRVTEALCGAGPVPAGQPQVRGQRETGHQNVWRIWIRIQTRIDSKVYRSRKTTPEILKSG